MMKHKMVYCEKCATKRPISTQSPLYDDDHLVWCIICGTNIHLTEAQHSEVFNLDG